MSIKNFFRCSGSAGSRPAVGRPREEVASNFINIPPIPSTFSTSTNSLHSPSDPQAPTTHHAFQESSLLPLLDNQQVLPIPQSRTHSAQSNHVTIEASSSTSRFSSSAAAIPITSAMPFSPGASEPGALSEGEQDKDADYVEVGDKDEDEEIFEETTRLTPGRDLSKDKIEVAKEMYDKIENLLNTRSLRQGKPLNLACQHVSQCPTIPQSSAYRKGLSYKAAEWVVRRQKSHWKVSARWSLPASGWKLSLIINDFHMFCIP